MKKVCAILAGAWIFADGAVRLFAGQGTAVIGDPTHGAVLPEALTNIYQRGARDITIAPGTYRIPKIGKDAIVLNDWTNTVIHARQVTLIFEELSKTPITLNRCDHVTLEGSTLRFSEPSFTQGRIVAVGHDDRGKYFDWQIDAGYPIFDAGKSCFDVMDHATRLLKSGTGDMGCEKAEPLGRDCFRLRGLNGSPGSAAVDDWLFTRRPDGGGPIVHLDRCGHCTLREITLENAGFAAFFETGGEGGHHYVDCRVAPGPKPPGASEQQLVGCGADGFHSAGTTNGPTIERCAWEGVLHDDCIAIHGALQQVVRAEGRKLILVKGNQAGFAVGEPVRISSRNGYFDEFTATNLRVLENEGGLLELTLDRESAAPPEAKASNPRHNGAGFKILHCKLGNCRSRGILVKADNGLIENCDISGCGMSAISIGPEYDWGEADYSRNVTLRGNTLRNNVLNGSDAGTIRLHGDGAVGNSKITLANNFFDRNYGRITIAVEDADGVQIDDNRFIASSIPLPEAKSRTILDLKTSKNINLRNNKVENLAEGDTLVSVGKNVNAIAGNDPSGISPVAPSK